MSDNSIQQNKIMHTESDNILLTYKEVARACRLSVSAIKKWVERGTVVVERNGGSARIPISALSPTAQARAREILAESELT